MHPAQYGIAQVSRQFLRALILWPGTAWPLPEVEVILVSRHYKMIQCVPRLAK